MPGGTPRRGHQPPGRGRRPRAPPPALRSPRSPFPRPPAPGSSAPGPGGVPRAIVVVFLDTGYHFAETIGTRDAVEAVYPIHLVNVTPSRTVAEQDAELGPGLFGVTLTRW